MRYYKIGGGYIASPGVIPGAEEISREEYDRFISIVRSRPVAPDGFDYRLTESLEWELYELPPEDPDPEVSACEALEIILGGDANASI